MSAADLVFIGIRGAVVALHRTHGGQVWATDLKGSQFVSLHLDRDVLLATTYGEVFCLAPETGRVLWHNPLRGYGIGLSSIATASGSSAAVMAAAEQRRRDAEAAAASA
jgi:outer membrane protein assembly factor BamB